MILSDNLTKFVNHITINMQHKSQAGNSPQNMQPHIKHPKAIQIHTNSHVHNTLRKSYIYCTLYIRKAKVEKEVGDTLNLFNRNFATFFNTGGNLAGLNEFPAANMIKRRIFQEINEWKKKNQLLVYDKDSFEIENITLLNTVTAVAVANEVWFLNVQEKDTRKKLSPVKANPIQVRYFLKKRDGMWGVVEYEVFGSKDDIPELKIERLYL